MQPQRLHPGLPLRKPFMFRLALIGFVTLSGLQASQAAADAEPGRVQLAQSGQTAWRVFLPESAGAVERFACEELTRYIEQMCGARLGKAAGPDLPFTIQIGQRSALSTADRLPPAKPGYDGYAVSVAPQSIIIAGANPRGVLYGAYDLLERLGCRWCYPTQDPDDPECVPRRERLTLAAGAWAVASPLRYRICNGSSWFFEMDLDAAARQLDWAMKNRYNAMGWQSESKTPIVAQYQGMKSAGLFDELDRRGMLLHGPGHCFDHFLRAEDHMDAHPEWFGMRDGKRVPQNFFGAQFCWSNAQARKQFIANLTEFVTACPRIDILMILSFDGGRACACESCTAAGASNLLMQLMGEVIDHLQTVAPHLPVETVGGYEPMTEPPTEAKIHPKQRVVWAHWGRRYDGGYGDAGYGRRENLETWRKAAKGGLTICQYYTDNFAEPWVLPPFAVSLTADRRYFIDNKIESVYMLFWPPVYWSNHILNGYISGRCFYDASLDPFQEIRDHALHYYGPDAGPLIAAYYDQWARNVNLGYRVKDDATDADREILAEQRRKFIGPAIKAAAADPVLARRVGKVARLHTLAERLAEGHRLRQQIRGLRESGELIQAGLLLDRAKSVTDGILDYFHVLADLNQGLIEKKEIPGFITLGVKAWIDEEAKIIEAALGNTGASTTSNTVELASDGQTAWKVFVPQDAGPVENFAAGELTRYFEKISTARLGSTAQPDEPHTIQVALRSKLPDAQELPASQPGFDGYAISVQATRIIVAGDNPRGVLYGVYDLLERLGCCWYIQGLDPQDPEVVPQEMRPTLAAGSWAHASPIEFRMCNASSLLFEIIPERLLPQIDWAAKNRYNVLSWQAHHTPGSVAREMQQMADCGGLDEMTRRGLIQHGPGHCFPFFLPSEQYFDQHPEWFGLKNGKRVGHGTELPLTNFCWSNPAACDEFIRNAETFVARWPQLKMLYMVGIDGGAICDCPDCRARGSSDLIVDLFNRLSARLAEVAPEVIVETVIGYGLLENPPTSAIPNGKWRGLYAHWGRNHAQSYGDAEYSKKANLESWTRLFPRYTVCSYYAAASHQPFHSPPFLHAIEGDTEYLVDRGASGHLTLQYPHGFWWNYSFNLAAAGQHAYYYPQRLPRAQLKDYAASCFGPEAGPLVEQYLAALGNNENLDASYRAGRGQATPADMRRLQTLHQTLKAAAQAAAKDPIHSLRVAKLDAAMEFLQHLGPTRSSVDQADDARKAYQAGKTENGKVEQTIADARSRISNLEARAEELGQSVPGIMDARWMRDWIIKRTLSGPLDQIDREFKAAATQPAASSPLGVAPEWQRTNPDIVVYLPKGEAFHDTDNEHFLVLASPSGKELLATWTQSSCEGRGDNRIMTSRSVDGVQWSEPKMIVGTAPGSKGGQASWGVPIISRKGRIYCFYTRQTALNDGNPQGCGTMGCLYSDDHGQSWMPGSDIPMPRNQFDNPDPEVPKNWIAWQLPIRDSKNRLLLGYTQVTSPARMDRKVPWYAWSSRCQFMRFENIDEAPAPADLRVTWLPLDSKGLEVPHPNYDWSSCSEPSTVLLPDGRLFATMRTWTGQIWYSVSEDDGETWRPTEILRYKDGGEPVQHPLAPCPIYALQDGRFLLLFHNNDGHIGPNNQREKAWKHNYLNFLRHPAFLAVGEYRRQAHQPIWFSQPRQVFDTQGVAIGPKGTTEVATYTSLTEWGGSRILWYPDRKYFLLGKRITDEWLAELQAPAR